MSGERAYVGAHYTGEQWVAAAFEGAAFEGTRVLADAGELWGAHEDAARLLVDVPIGLPGDGDGRRCDELARAVVGDRAATLFEAPVREAIRKRRYGPAARTHERATGRQLDRAAFERCPEIALVDELLGTVPEARGSVAESHPEVCFRAFAGAPLGHSRSVAAGYAERLRALAEHDREAPPAVQAAAEGVAGHDVRIEAVLDAVALAYTARPGPGELRSLPPTPDVDAEGRAMAIRYRAPEPLLDEG